MPRHKGMSATLHECPKMAMNDSKNACFRAGTETRPYSMSSSSRLFVKRRRHGVVDSYSQHKKIVGIISKRPFKTQHSTFKTQHFYCVIQYFFLLLQRGRQKSRHQAAMPCTSHTMEQEKYELLSHIKYPEDLRKLKVDQLPKLCDELRRDIVEELSVNPGHLASSLGVVELTVHCTTSITHPTTASYGMWDTKPTDIRYSQDGATSSAPTA